VAKDSNNETNKMTAPSAAKSSGVPVDAATLGADLLKQVSSGDVELPPMSSLARYASRLRTTPDISSHDLQLLIEGEPAVASQVIRLANTAYYKPPGPGVSNLRLALVRLGNRTVANLIETVAMSDFYQTGPDVAVRYLRKMWTSTLYSAIAARELARLSQTADPEDAYLLGLFHNVGEPLLIRLLASEKYVHLLRAEQESTVFSVMDSWHEPIGKRLLKAWSFPATAVDIAGSHHQEPDSDLRAIVCLAYESALSYGYTYFEHKPAEERRNQAAALLELSAEDVASLPQRIGPTLNEALGITARS